MQYFSLLLVSLSVFAADPKPEVGRLIGVQGNVLVDGRKGEDGFILRSGVMVKTEDDSKATLLFGNESVVHLAANSEFKVNEYVAKGKEETADFNLVKGRTRALIKNKGKTKKKFRFRTKTATMGVRGTRISFSENEIVVEEGNVTVSRNTPEQQQQTTTPGARANQGQSGDQGQSGQTSQGDQQKKPGASGATETADADAPPPADGEGPRPGEGPPGGAPIPGGAGFAGESFTLGPNQGMGFGAGAIDAGGFQMLDLDFEAIQEFASDIAPPPPELVTHADFMHFQETGYLPPEFDPYGEDFDYPPPDDNYYFDPTTDGGEMFVDVFSEVI